MSTSKRKGRRPQQLPGGRHGLSREAVETSQRMRMLTAMVEAVAEQGYAETRVVDVIVRAGVSRKTFYEHFTDKEQCFLAAYDHELAGLMAATTQAYEDAASAPWAERLHAGLSVLLHYMAERPAAARTCIVEVLSAGPKALARRDAAVRGFTYFIDAGRAECTVEVPGITALALIGGINEVLYTQILHGATADLPNLLPDFMYWIIQPFLGPEQAAQARVRARKQLTEGRPAAVPTGA